MTKATRKRTLEAASRFTPTAVWAIALAAAGCSAQGLEGPDEDPIGRVGQALTSEGNGTNLPSRDRWDDPNMTLRGYAASTKFKGGLSCSGAMIGPNIYATAAHCSSIVDTRNVEFRLHRSGNVTASF
jgi:V8-like Glu-specific endopeptidase